MSDREFLLQVQGYGLMTAEISYYMPYHPKLIQLFVYQQYDLAPRFPVLHRFLDHWRSDIEAVLQSPGQGQGFIETEIGVGCALLPQQVPRRHVHALDQRHEFLARRGLDEILYHLRLGPGRPDQRERIARSSARGVMVDGNAHPQHAACGAIAGAQQFASAELAERAESSGLSP